MGNESHHDLHIKRIVFSLFSFFQTFSSSFALEYAKKKKNESYWVIAWYRLQSLIYSNVLFSFVYIIIQLFVSIHKVIARDTEEPMRSRSGVLLSMGFVEPIRLYNGYKEIYMRKYRCWQQRTSYIFTSEWNHVNLIASEIAFRLRSFKRDSSRFRCASECVRIFTLNRLLFTIEQTLHSVSSIGSKKVNGKNLGDSVGMMRKSGSNGIFILNFNITKKTHRKNMRHKPPPTSSCQYL